MARSSDLKALRRSPKGPKHRPSAEPKPELTRSGRDGDTGVALAPEPPKTALWEFGALDSGTREIQLSNVRVEIVLPPKGQMGPLYPYTQTRWPLVWNDSEKPFQYGYP